MKFVFPPRPKGKMLPVDLPLYEKSGEWLAQRKFRGSRALIYISKDKQVFLGSRYGRPFSNFDLDNNRKDELLSLLALEKEKDYLLDGELMNKDVNSSKEIIFFDVLKVGKYFFYHPTQIERLKILEEICCYPKNLCDSGIALEISKNFLMAQTFYDKFDERYKESLLNPRLEGLVLRKRNKGLDHSGENEYETSDLLRCRKPFSQEKGYEF